MSHSVRARSQSFSARHVASLTVDSTVAEQSADSFWAVGDRVTQLRDGVSGFLIGDVK